MVLNSRPALWSTDLVNPPSFLSLSIYCSATMLINPNNRLNMTLSIGAAYKPSTRGT